MAGFVKLDVGVLDSTLWGDFVGRNVFITALLMASPMEFTEPVPQIEIDSLNHTGWEAPPGWYGFVPAASVGIVMRAMVDREQGLEALRRMGSPEPDSRSQEFEGRRLIRIDGGFLILNYMRYRDKDYTAKDRQQRYRDRQKAKKSVVVTRDGEDVTRNITQAEVQMAEVQKAEQRAGWLAASGTGKQKGEGGSTPVPPPTNDTEAAERRRHIEAMIAKVSGARGVRR